MSLLDHPILVPAGASAGGIRRALALTATLALVAVAILLPVMQNSDEAAQGYRIRTLDRQRTDLEAQIYIAQSDIARLGSLARTDGEARARLGMVPATREVNVTVSEPVPDVHRIPNGYLPVTDQATPPTRTSFWMKLLHFLPLS
jgi:hypothetical protein